MNGGQRGRQVHATGQAAGGDGTAVPGHRRQVGHRVVEPTLSTPRDGGKRHRRRADGLHG